MFRIKNAFYLLTTILLLNESVSEKCVTVINEVNTGSPGALKKSDSIELKMICENNAEGKNLQGYKLIGLSVQSGKTVQTLIIDFVVNLWNSKVGENSMFTIGAADLPRTNMKMNSDYVTFRNKFTANSKTLHTFFNRDESHLHGIALLYKQNHAFPQLVLNAKNPTTHVNSEIEQLIKSNLVDLVVYGRKSPYDNCKTFIKLYSDYDLKGFILREFDNNLLRNEKDRTLNRCSLDRSTFIPEKFKLGSPTPGLENDCTGPNFFLEHHLSTLTDPLQSVPLDLDEIDTPQCSSSQVVDMYQSISDTTIEEKVSEESERSQKSGCSALNLESDGNIADELDRTQRRKRKLSGTTNYAEELEWETLSHFQ